MIDEMIRDKEIFARLYPNLDVEVVKARRDKFYAALNLLDPRTDDEREEFTLDILRICNDACSPYLDYRYSTSRKQFLAVNAALKNLDRALSNLRPELLADLCLLALIDRGEIHQQRFLRQGRKGNYDLQLLQRHASDHAPELINALALRCRAVVNSYPPKKDGRPPYFKANYLVRVALSYFDNYWLGEAKRDKEEFPELVGYLYEFCTGKKDPDLRRAIKNAFQCYEPLMERKTSKNP